MDSSATSNLRASRAGEWNLYLKGRGMVTSSSSFLRGVNISSISRLRAGEMDTSSMSSFKAAEWIGFLLDL